ncbi:MAG: AEC family transporter [Thermoproteota archaeon]
MFATVSASTIALVSVFIYLTMLEAYRMEKASLLRCVECVVSRFYRNPLIISVFIGIILSLTGIKIPDLMASPLRMLGGTAITVSIFMLGAFLHGRRYSGFLKAFGLSLPRIVILPSLGLLVSRLLSLSRIQTAVVVIMNNVSLAVSMIVLSERYGLYEELVSMLILVSSLGCRFILEYVVINYRLIDVS